MNQKKHGIGFQETVSVFSDEQALFLEDPAHSDQEDRFMLLGLSAALRMLVVCHCFRSRDDVIRIISARKATRRERTQYTQRWKS